jgi:hypothetical protein
MLLYWGMFTVGFSIGAIFSFITFATKRPEEEADYKINGLPGSKVNPTTQFQVTPTPQTVKES